MNDLLTRIKDGRDRKFADLRALAESKSPIVMYGAGSYAADVSLFLQSHGIEIETYCIDGEYLQTGLRGPNNSIVTAIEDAIDRYQDITVVIGFSDYISARKKLERLNVRENVYFIDAPNQYGFFDRDYIARQLEKFQESYDMLADEKSRNIFIDFINAKISGDPTPLYKHAEFNQYFGDPVRLANNETFVDCGAFDGDTIRSFMSNTGGTYRKIYTFEPDPKNFDKLTTYINDSHIQNVFPVNAGCWSSRTTLNFSSHANMAAIGPDESNVSIKTEKIDDIITSDTVTFIKMDIEGAEIEALKGAEQTIRREHPTLAICVYHKPEDLITIPQLIRHFNGNYKFYLRHHQFMSWEMVLYAIEEK